MADYTRFRTINNIGDCLLSDTIESNLIEFFRWGFLGIGAFFNVTIPTSGHFGGNQHKLRLADAKGYTKGQVWEGFRKDWVWESGVEYSTQPIQISGVYVNGTFVPKNSTGAYAHEIDYPNGRIIFHNAISNTATVTCEHSFRYIQCYDASKPWFTKLQMNSFRIDDNHYSLFGSGIYNIPPEQRLQLPAVVIRVLPIESSRPKQIGDLSRWASKEVDFHIVTETDFELKQIHDIIHDCYEKTLIMFNKNSLINNQAFPLNSSGNLSQNPKTYPQLIAPTGNGGYEYKEISFKKIRSHEGETNSNYPLFYTIVRTTMEIDV